MTHGWNSTDFSLLLLFLFFLYLTGYVYVQSTYLEFENKQRSTDTTQTSIEYSSRHNDRNITKKEEVEEQTFFYCCIQSQLTWVWLGVFALDWFGFVHRLLYNSACDVLLVVSCFMYGGSSHEYYSRDEVIDFCFALGAHYSICSGQMASFMSRWTLIHKLSYRTAAK